MTTPSRVVVLTPVVGGRDGLSELSRQVITASAGEGVPVTVLALAGAAHFSHPAASIELVSARGHRARLVRHVAVDSLHWGRGTRVIVMHANLLPLVLPATLGRSEIVAVLVGIEAWRPLSVLERSALRRVQTVVAISAHTASGFAAANPAFATSTVRICHPAVPELVPPLPADRAPGYALMVGRMWSAERYKGHDRVLEAWPAVLASHPGARLVVAGDGDDRPRLMARAAALGVAPAVDFVGAVDDARLAALYRGCAFFVMPSRDEGFGLVYLEAMRTGHACIASPGAAAEFITHGVNGWLVDPGDVAAIAGACVRFLQDPTLTARLGPAAAATVCRDYQFEQFAARWRQALAGLPAPC